MLEVGDVRRLAKYELAGLLHPPFSSRSPDSPGTWQLVVWRAQTTSESQMSSEPLLSALWPDAERLWSLEISIRSTELIYGTIFNTRTRRYVSRYEAH